MSTAPQNRHECPTASATHRTRKTFEPDKRFLSIAKSIENSIQNSENPDFIPLPETLDLIGENIDAYGKSNVVYSQQNLIYQLKQQTNYH